MQLLKEQTKTVYKKLVLNIQTAEKEVEFPLQNTENIQAHKK